ncbi:MAG: zinc-ribbon domain-containing protein [Chloroflexi bacterium]|nr:zinc-ribbon domain-containing protein [Chloroflexota bacterium]
MAGWNDLGNIWNTFKELDVRPIADEAERPIVLAFVGAAGVGKSTLIAALRHDKRAREKVISPTMEADLRVAPAARLGDADLIVLMLDATAPDISAETELYANLKSAGRALLIFYNKMDALSDASAVANSLNQWVGTRIAVGSALDPDSLATEFVPRVMDALRSRHLALARHYPLFRDAVARALINDTAFANASYALGTGFAEIIPVLDVPFNIADLVVLTKNQAMMVYKLGLALGRSTRWQDHMAELGSVVGAGFLWRQAARQLIGLIPVWGIVPKVAIAYAGTFAVGEAVLYWYHTGKKMTGNDLRAAYNHALRRGKEIAQKLIERAPRPGLPKLRMPRVTFPALPKPRTKNVCPNCGKRNPREARFCAYCATALISP